MTIFKAFTSSLIFAIFFSSLSFSQWSLDTVITVGTNTTGIAITPAGDKLVVTNNTSPGSVSIISTSDYSAQTVDVSSIENYPNAVAVSPDGSTAYVNTLHKIISVNLSDNSVKSVLTAPCASTTLYGISITQNGLNIVFPDLSSGCTQQGIRIFNVSSGSSLTSFIPVNTSGVLSGIALTPDGGYALVTTFSSGSPKIVNLSTNDVQNISGITSGSYGVATLHKSNQALIFDGDSLDLVSLTSNSLVKKISYLTYNTTLQNIAITNDDKYAFVVGAFEKLIISLSDYSVIETFTAGGTSVACNSDGSFFYVTDSYNGTVRVYKKDSPTLISTGFYSPPGRFNLQQNYPNPFNPSTTIGYSVPTTCFVSLKVYDLLGNEIAVLVNGEKAPGNYKAVFPPQNGIASKFSSGIYFYRLQAGNFSETKKLLLLK